MSEEKVNAGVCVVILDPSGRVLMGKRKGAHGAGTWSVPGGWINTSDVDLIAAAKREVLEETGLTIYELRVVDATLSHFPGRSSVTIMMLALAFLGVPAALESEKLDGDWLWFDPSALPSPLFAPLLNSAFFMDLRNGSHTLLQ